MRVAYSLLLLLVLPVLLCGQTIVTVAGNGVAGYGGDGGNALSAKFDHPDVIRLDGAGNKYVVDEHNHVIRKINAAGIITTIAGTGYGAGTTSGGYSGDGGQATNARLSRPSDVSFDASGNIYISEAGNCTIRKVDMSGVITTYAGTGSCGYDGDNIPATSTRLSNPFGLVFDIAGNLYFSDNGNRRVRKINSAGIITTVAGTGTAGYTGDNGPATNAKMRPTGYLSISSANELFIPDYYNSVIRKVDASGTITTIIGNGSMGSGGDGGPATDASLTSPFAMIFDASGNMLVSDRSANVIRKINTSGIISTIAGTGTAGYYGDGGPALSAQLNTDLYCSAVDAWGNLYIADPVNNRIRRINYNTSVVNALPDEPEQVTISPNPATDVVTIKAATEIRDIRVVDAMGREAPLPGHPQGRGEVTVDISHLPAGVYVVKVNGVYGGRFLKG